jgi:hypothetical protein
LDFLWIVVGARALLFLLLCFVFLFVSRNCNSALFNSLIMASAEDSVICDHSDWPTWIVVELACKYPGCKFYRPPSKPPPLALFSFKNLAETSSPVVLYTNKSVSNDNDAEANSSQSSSHDNLVRSLDFADDAGGSVDSHNDAQFSFSTSSPSHLRPNVRRRSPSPALTVNTTIATIRPLFDGPDIGHANVNNYVG